MSLSSFYHIDLFSLSLTILFLKKIHLMLIIYSSTIKYSVISLLTIFSSSIFHFINILLNSNYTFSICYSFYCILFFHFTHSCAVLSLWLLCIGMILSQKLSEAMFYFEFFSLFYEIDWYAEGIYFYEKKIVI